MSQLKTFDEAFAIFLNHLHDELVVNGSHLEEGAEYAEEHLFNVDGDLIISDADYRTISKMSNRKIAKAFKEKFGYSDVEYLDGQRKLYWASLLPREREILEDLEEYNVTTFRIEDGKMLGAYFLRGKDSIGVYMSPNDWGNETILKAKYFAAWDMTLAEGIEMFEKLGFVKTKRPKHPKFQNYSLYD